MDSLSFRNQQLAKRVELLQEELVVCETKGKKGKVIIKLRVSMTVKLSELKVSRNSLIFFSTCRIRGTLLHIIAWRPKTFLMRTCRKRLKKTSGFISK